MADEPTGTVLSGGEGAAPAPAATPAATPAPAAAGGGAAPSPAPKGGAAAAPAAAGGAAAPPAAKWRDDWRDALATVNGEVDQKLRKQLDRYAAPEDVWKAHVSLRTRMDSGEFIQKLAKDAKPEEVATWRKENGIPEKVDGYLENLPRGIVIPEADKPLVGKFLEGIHAANAPPAVAHAALESYYRLQETIAAESATRDLQARQSAEDTLRQEWGGEYRANLNAISNFLVNAPAGFRDALVNGQVRLADGTPALSNVDVVKWLANLSREINPAASLVPAGTSNQPKALDARIGEIEGMMRNPAQRAAYFKNEKLQSEYRSLLEAREKIAARAA